MLCRCARAAMKRCTSTLAIPSADIIGGRQSRFGPYATCISVMTSSSLSNDRRVPINSDQNGIRPRANMSAVAEELHDEGHAETEFAVPVIPLQMRPLNEQGSAGARRCRRDGYTPGVVYAAGDGEKGRGEQLMVKIKTKFATNEIRRLESSFENTVYRMIFEGQEGGEEEEEGSASAAPAAAAGGAMDGTQGLVLVKQVLLHPARNSVLSMNFIRYKAGRRHPVPIRYVNEDLNVNIKKGATILRLRTHQYIILPENPAEVPQWLDLDLQHVQSGDKLRVRDVALPPGLSFFRGNEDQVWDEVICTVKGKKAAGGKTEERDVGDEED